MSTLQYLREKAGLLVAVVIGVSLLIFVVGDFLGSGSGQRSQAKKYYEIAKIGDEAVSYQDFDARTQSLIEIYKLSGATTITEEMTESIREQTWQQLLREKVLGTQFKKIGLSVSNEEVNSFVFGDTPHPIVAQLFTDQETGMFNRSFMVGFLKNIDLDPSAKAYWLFFENEIVTDRLNTKFSNLVGKGLYITSKQADFEMKMAQREVDFTFVSRNLSEIADSSVVINDADIKEYYNDHKNKYKTTAKRDIEYVTFDIAPSEDDFKQAEIWIERTKEEFLEAEDPAQFINLTSDTRHSGLYVSASNIDPVFRDFAVAGDKNAVFGPVLVDNSYKLARLIDISERPDSVRARHILLSPNQVRTLAQAKTEADSIIKLVKSGKDFSSLATVLSDDQGSANLGGDLGWFAEGQMVAPFNNACFSGRTGDIVAVETQFGIHVIQILNQSARSKKYNLGIVERNVEAGSITVQQIYANASRFVGTNNTQEKFNKAIADNNLVKKVANDVAPDQKSLPGLENSRYLIISLFDTEEGNLVLDNSDQAIFDLGDKYVVGFCSSVQEEGFAPLENVKSEVRFLLVNEKKADLVAADFSKLIKDGKSIEEIARNSNLQIMDAEAINFRSFSVPGIGVAPELVAAASASPEGKLVGPVKGANAVYCLYVNASREIPSETGEMVKERLSAMMQLRSSYEMFESLRTEMGVVDKRYRFY